MKIHKLEITNFRGVQLLKLDELHKRLNVFVGVNGAGKSTVLDASAILLSWMVSRIRHAGTSGRHIQESDIRNTESTANLDVTCKYQGRYFEWNLAKTRKGRSKKEAVSVLVALTEVAKQVQEAITDSDERINLPLFTYYPVNRAVLDIPLRIKGKHRFDLLEAYDEALSGGASFRQFFEWFRQREDLENENRKYVDQLIKPEGFQFPDPQLEAVRKALSVLMSEFQNLSVRRNPLRMEVEKNGERLTISQLSDGEKCLMAMVGDLARRLAIANPVAADPLTGEGMVLIDEIDLHLHPKWQRMIIPRLLQVFPNCQFIISTHSPHVVTHVRAENLYLLTQTENGIVAEKPSESYGKTANRVLEDLMGLETTRPDAVDEKLRHLFDEIDAGHFSEARKLIKEMSDDIGEDPELAKAEVLIRRKEIIGK